ncbi:hypothetical protein [Rhodobacter calidifons]|uniref:Uncharacterized protein n=1 Tax=Rhodobacter calidifons TaxID=2715277 RepID=A0ABX0GCR5_9RHOB|nr:hypothetical protein [Rhodobacter calidifons]NHB78570.1 hypothetical protein [Rhodobacter calidifons]
MKLKHLFPVPTPAPARPVMVWTVSAKTGRPVCGWVQTPVPVAPGVADMLAALIARHRSLRAA